ncbi:two-partner secretion domain-containing protein [Bradyrhizobium japonicum]|uniref:two-partner secretion domain-containing protein n=1 Tax=Bradyrhizobium japonicum TaxID=375 RepID=UPI0004568E24|nr:filamentous hemagglutinin N-terminal domain-containing protein [Bradyrhizobium japonicum]AHY55593.1 type Vb secretion system, passenger domain protein [Bradyrhizobium japonicum SEMIA 5079]MCD9107864.1 filamentous hemagglutinin N-terminal domain-containing protein [Bradyrhizobium japonicum]MCD9252269.1 filamentous hemagglutinin N-terminal domain-containing protein [Bradyrhizobium japonicum SEMIA 5079]MCD9816745.1 filamentous hemagglutinin N-terminal domain-containing protein [Bradyrhizobium j
MTSTLPRMRLAIALSATTMLTPPALAQTLPTGGQVVSGQATISQSGNAMTINQSSDRMIANWQSFSIGAGSSVTFNQPGASSVALNRVVGQDPSRILGSLSANGQVFLINPNGIAIGKTGSVQTGGFVASTLGISNADFLAGRYNFTGSGGAITNEGSISGKVVALISPSVSNSGSITGSTALAAGTDVLLDFNGDGLLSVEVKASTVKTLAENKGLIRADGGLAILTAKGASDAMKGVVNNTGVVQAASIGSRNGRILLLGDARHGEVNAGGTLRARSVETSAAKVNLAADLKVDTLGGHWLIDPVNITIDANYASALQTALASGDVTVTTSGSGADAGNVTVNSAVTWGSHILTLRADNNIVINAPLTSTGTTSSDGLVLQYAQTTATGGYTISAPVNLAAGSLFQTRKGSDAAITYAVITDVNALQNINTNRSGNYVLGANIDASATAGWNGGAGFTPIGGIGDISSYFSGIFDGLGHHISNLTINRPSSDNIGLFGYIDGGTIRNVGLEGGSVTGNNAVGGLVGSSGLWVYGGTSSVAYNTISNVYNTGNVTGSGAMVGGLVGDAYITTISNSYATGTVAGYGAAGGLGGRVVASSISNSYATGNVSAVWDGAGGLIGYNIGTWMGPGPADYAIGTVSHSHATGTVTGGVNVGGLLGYSNIGLVTDSYATGNVSGTGSNGGTGTSAGGLVGFASYSQVERSYATGNVSGVDAVGGLVGGDWYGGTVSQSYATGNVSGTRSVGGLVGHSNEAVSVLDSYATGAVSGNSEVGGLVGVNQESHVGRSYFAGTVSGASNVGAIVGMNWDGGDVTQSYANRDTSGQSAACGASFGGGICDGGMLTTAQLRDPFTFINNGFDFAAVWGKSVSGANNGMPVLRAFGDTVYDAYVNVAGSASTTYGTLGSLGGLTMTGVNAHRVTLGWGSAVTTALGAGSYNLGGPDVLNATGSGGAVYVGSVAVGLTIDRAALTISANASKIYDGLAFSGGSVAYSGFMNGETASVLSGTLSYGGTAQGAVNAGRYGLTASGLSSANYAITYVDGSLTVNKAPLTIAVNGVTKIYDGVPFSGGSAIYSGFVNGEGLSALSGTLIYSGSAQGTRNPGVYSIAASGLTSANYGITYVDSRLAIIPRDAGACSLGAGGNPVCGATPPNPAAPLGLNDQAPIEVVLP